MHRHPMPLDTIRARYPRLIRAMCWAACLTSSEAVGAIYDHQIGDRWAGEAVNHFGGIPAVLAAAMRRDARVMARRYLA